MRIPGMKRKKKQVTCPRCKKTVPAQTVFCEFCGARVAHPPSCPLCGTLLAPGSRFCPSCGTPVPRDEEIPDAPCEPVGLNQRDAAYTPENSAGSVPVTPSSTGDTGQKNSDIPVSSSPGPSPEKPVGVQKFPHKKRSVVTVIPEPDEKVRPVFSLVPVPAIASKKYLILILIAIVVIAGIAVFEGKLRLPSPGSSAGFADSADLAVGGTGSAPEQVAATPAIIAQVINLTPGPTQVPPDNLLVYFQAERDPTSRIVSVRFTGGKGQAGVQDVFVRLTRSDGQVLTGSFRPLQVGSGVEFPGTGKVDRVEVIVHYYNGDSYTVIDRTFEWEKML
jgi:Double zinc ribbon